MRCRAGTRCGNQIKTVSRLAYSRTAALSRPSSRMQIFSDRTINGTLQAELAIDRPAVAAGRGEVTLASGGGADRGHGVRNVPGNMDKTQMIRPNFTKAPESETIRQNVGHVVQDVVALAELQGQLFRERCPRNQRTCRAARRRLHAGRTAPGGDCSRVLAGDCRRAGGCRSSSGSRPMPWWPWQAWSSR